MLYGSGFYPLQSSYMYVSIAYVYTRQCIGIRRIATRERVVEPVYPLKNEIF